MRVCVVVVFLVAAGGCHLVLPLGEAPLDGGRRADHAVHDAVESDAPNDTLGEPGVTSCPSPLTPCGTVCCLLD